MPRSAEKLTKRKLDALRSKAQADPAFSAFVADAGQPGLHAWARRGKVRFVFAYRPPNGGRRRRRQIDEFGAITLDQARAVALDLRGKVAAGIDPQVEEAERRRLAVTVEDAAKRYLEDFRLRAESGAKRGKKGSYEGTRRLLERNVLPSLGRLQLRNVTLDQVRQMHRKMRETPVEANRTLTALSAVYGFADKEQLVEPKFNPCRHVDRFRERGSRRALTRDELSALGAALRSAEGSGSVDQAALLAVRLLALTGMRRAEVLGHTLRNRRGEREGLRWSDVNFDEGVIELADTKTGRQTRVVGSAVVRLLEQAKPDDAAQDDPICPGRVSGQPFIGIDKARKKLWSAAELEGVDLHSLRHSFASIGAHLSSGRFAAFVGPLLGHGYTQQSSITARYIHEDRSSLRSAADAISGEISRLLDAADASGAVDSPNS